MYDFRITKNNIYIFIEYCNGGNLQTHMKKHNNKFSDVEVLRILQEICRGFQHLYENKIIHRDMKPENIMIHNGSIKISDFGFARFIEDPNKAQNLTLKGTPLYLPPQIFDGGLYSSKFDIWSIGAILHELLFEGKQLLSNVKNMEQLRVKLLSFQKREIAYPSSNRDPRILHILSSMLKYNEDDRISWPEIFQA